MKISYTEEQKKKAIQTYKRLGSCSKTIRRLGYPTAHTLYEWVRGSSRKKSTNPNPYDFKRYSWKIKLEAVTRVNEGEAFEDVAESLGIINSAIIYKWLRAWRSKGKIGLMSKKEKIEQGVYKTKAQLKKELPDNVEELKDLAAQLLVKNAALEKELELRKKSEGGIPNKLPPKYKSRIAYSLKDRYPLEMLLEVLDLKRSSYYYSLYAAAKPDKYAGLRLLIHEISDESAHTYGSERIWLVLRRRNVKVSEKVVRRLIKEEHIEVRCFKGRRRYSSYIGETTPAADDLVQRNFHADRPNKLWLSDITQFAASDAKVYLSPVMDCYDGKIIAYALSRHPDMGLVETMLDRAFATLEDSEEQDEPLILHTDRGGHYRGEAWIERLEAKGVKRSMSRKGNTGDNAALEGFFGRMKNEMYFGKRWKKASDLEEAIVDYIDFYDNRRIKASLGGLTIKEYREAMLENV